MDRIAPPPTRSGRRRALAAPPSVLVVALLVVALVALHPWDRDDSSTSAPVLLVRADPSFGSDQVAFGGVQEFRVNAHRCVTFGGSLVIAEPGSSLSADGRTLTLVFAVGGRHTFRIGEPVHLGLGGGSAFLAYPSTVPRLADGRSVADCVTGGRAAVALLQEADAAVPR